MAAATTNLTSRVKTLEKILNENYVLQTKDVANSFGRLKIAAQKRTKGGNDAEVVAALDDLETCLKKERVYRKIRSDFEKAKSDIVQSSQKLPEARHLPGNQRSPRETGQEETGVRPTTLSVAVKPMPIVTKKYQQHEKKSVASKTGHQDNNKQSMISVDEGLVTHDEISSLNKTIQRLFDHLDIGSKTNAKNVSKQKRSGSDPHASLSRGMTYTAISLSAKARQKRRDEDAFKTILQKLKQFEEEFQRRKLKQQTDLKKLQEENDVVRSQLTKQTREIDRLRGTQSIVSKAKGKHVEKLEERYLLEKRGIELKMRELEENLRKSVQRLESTTKEKIELEERVSQDMMRLKSEIYSLHSLSNRTENKELQNTRQGRQSPRNVIRRGNLSRGKTEKYSVGDFVEKLEWVGDKIRKTQEERTDLTKHVSSSGQFEKQMSELTTVISALSDEFSLDMSDFDDTDRKNKSKRQFSFYASSDIADSTANKLSKNKTILQKFRALIIEKNEEIAALKRSLKDKQCELDEAKMNLMDVTGEIAKVHECIDKSQYDDITSVGSSPRRTKNVRSSNHSLTRKVQSEKRHSGKLLLLDDLPEAEGMGHDNALKQLGHIRKSVLEYKMSSHKTDKDMKNLVNDFELLKAKINSSYQSCMSRNDDSSDSSRPHSLMNRRAEISTPVKSPQWAKTSEEAVSEDCRAAVEKLSALKGAFFDMKAKHTDKEKIDEQLKSLSSELLEMKSEVTQLHEEVVGRERSSSESSRSGIHRHRKRSTDSEGAGQILTTLRECKLKFAEKESSLESLKKELVDKELELDRVRQCITRMRLVVSSGSRSDIDIDSPTCTPFRDIPRHVLPDRRKETPMSESQSESTDTTPSSLLYQLEETLNSLIKQIQTSESEYQQREEESDQKINNLQQEVTKLTTKGIIREEELNSCKRELQSLQAKPQREATGGGDVFDTEHKSLTGSANPESLKRRVNILQRRLSTTETELSDVLRQRDVLANRLSAKAAADLTDNNPNITDLGDLNRPEKLAERFMQLYDDEWTCAFETMSERGDTDDDAIIQLLDVVVKSHDMCKGLGDKQLQGIWRALFLDDECKLRLEEDILSSITKVDIKTIKDLRKNTGLRTGLSVLKICMKNDFDGVITTNDTVVAFVNKCVELSWLMCLQDPPVVLDCSAKRGDNFDNTLFRHYTKSGDTVDYLVWPALRLYNGGPVICKGVVQPT
ncbi:hypothetical protein ScPMuIL_011530 [Solemya velum]